MRYLLNGVVVIFLLLGSNILYAEGPGWTGSSTVKSLVVTANGGINVRLSPELSACVSQSGYGANYASIYPDHPGLKSIHSNLLTAFMSGKKVKLYFGDSTCRALEMILDL